MDYLEVSANEALPDAATDHAEQTEREQKQNNADDKQIQQPVYRRPLEFTLARILHQLCVLAGKYDDAVAPLRVTQHATAQNHFVVVQYIPEI